MQKMEIWHSCMIYEQGIDIWSEGVHVKICLPRECSTPAYLVRYTFVNLG